MKNFSGNIRGLFLMMVAVLLVVLCGESANSESVKREYSGYICAGEDSTYMVWEESLDFYSGEQVILPLILELTSNSSKACSLPLKTTIIPLSEQKIIDVSLSGNIKILKNNNNLIPLKIIEKSIAFNHLKFRQTDYFQYINVKADLGQLDSGYYFVKIEFGNHERLSVLHISKTGLIIKASEDEALVFTQDKKTGEPVPGMDISVRVGNEFVCIGKTDSDGILMFKKADFPIAAKEILNPERFFIKATKADDAALCEMGFQHNPPDFVAYIYTERPIYLPGQTVHFKAILREKKGNILKPLTGKDIDVVVYNNNSDEILHKKITPNEFGSIYGTIDLKDGVSLGEYMIYIRHNSRSQVGFFKVEEYRKPEYLISVKPLKKYIVGGKKAKFEIIARYYFGKPLVNTDFTFKIDRRHLYGNENYGINYYAESWLHRYDEDKENSGDESWYSRDVNKGIKLKGKTDENGEAIVEINTGREAGKIYSVNAQILDSSRRPVKGTGSAITVAGDFKIDVKTDRNYYITGKPVTITVHSVNFSGKPVSVKIDMEIAQPVKFKKKDGNSGYRKTTILKKAIETDKEGNCSFQFKPGKLTGYFQIFAGSKDVSGNELWGFKDFYIEWKSGDICDMDNSEFIMNKERYEVDKNIDGLFYIPNHIKIDDGLHCLMTIETDKISQYRIVDCNKVTNQINLIAEKNLSPDFKLSMAFWKNNQFYSFDETIKVNSADHFIKVLLKSNKKEFQPRDDVTYRIRTLKETDGSPLSSEVSLGVVDESTYDLISDFDNDIINYFYGDRNYYDYDSGNSEGVKTYHSGLTLQSNSIPGDTIFQGDFTRGQPSIGLPEMADIINNIKTIRQYFPDTCYFNPHIITDENGEATVHVKLPDSLTTWRATAIANSKDSEFGQAEQKVTVSKNLLVRLITPRFLVENDEVVIMGIVHNYLNKAVEAEVSLEGEGVELLSPRIVKVAILPGEKADVEWNVRAVKPGEAKFTVKALTTEESDAVLMKIPLLPHGVKVVDAKAGSTEEKLELKFNLLENASKESAVLRLNLAPSLAGTLIDALEYLAAYPYGCIEQTMNRFIPNAVVQASLKEFGIRNGELEKQLPDMMKEGFKKIYDYQHKDGGWGWWKDDRTKPLMTALVVYGLSLADKAGYKVDRAKLLDGSFMLKNQLMKISNPNQRVFILFALSEADVKMNYFVNRLFEKRDKLDNYSQALLAITLCKHDEKEKAKIILESLEKTAEVHETYVYWKGKRAGSWSDNPVETTAYAVQAFLLIDPENPIVEKAVRYLTLSRRGRCWHSTKDTAAAVLAVMEYAKITKEMDPDFDAILYLNGRKLKEIKFTKADIATGGMTLNITGEDLKTGENIVTVEKSGRGKAYLTGTLTSYLKTKRAKAYAKGFKVKRKYYLVAKRTEKEIKAEKKRRERYNSNYYYGNDYIDYNRYGYYGNHGRNPAEKLIPLNEKEIIKLKPQDVVEVSLFVVGKTGMEYVMVEDMKPAGCEFVRDEGNKWRYRNGQSEFRDDRAVFFMDEMWRKSHNFRYRLRAETPGEFRVLPATASQMYFPDVSGGSEEFTVKIE